MTTPSTHEVAAPVRPDDTDDRDIEYVVDRTTGPPPARVGYEEYRRHVGETWHQRGFECTGFALAAVANYVIRKQLGDETAPSVSRRMLYEMAQFYDGEAFETGSTPRGALKGWQRAGVTTDEMWPYDPNDEKGNVHGTLTLARLLDARTRPLLRYARIASDDIDAMQRALAEGRALYASAEYHVGWFRLYLPGVEPVIEQRPDDAMKGGHAFVIVGYDERGFWIHNSFGPEWGDDGYALLPYADWQAHRRDCWVVDAEHVPADTTAQQPGATGPATVAAYRRLWPHLVVLRDDGLLAGDGLYEMDSGSVGTLLYLFQERTKEWSRRRLCVVADGGQLPIAEVIARYEPLCQQMMAAEIYPIFVVWETAWGHDLHDELIRWIDRLRGDAPLERPSAWTDPLVRRAIDRSVIRAMWGQIAERSTKASARRAGGVRLLAESVAYKRNQKPFDLHIVAHGAGDLIVPGLVELAPAPITTLTSVAPVTTIEQFAATTATSLSSGRVERMTVVALDDAAEQLDSLAPVDGSLLELVADVLGGVGVQVADALDGAAEEGGSRAVLGLARHLDGDATVERLRAEQRLDVRLLSAGAHVDLAFDPAVWTPLLEHLRAHRSADPPAAAPAAATPATEHEDPLARALREAKRRPNS